MVNYIRNKIENATPELFAICIQNDANQFCFVCLISSSSSFKVQTPDRRILVLAQRGARAIYSGSKNLYQSICTAQLKTSSIFYLMTTSRTSLLKLSMVGQLTTDLGRLFQSWMVLGKKDPGSGIRYKVVEYTTSNRADWYEVSDLSLNAPSTIVQICRVGSSLVEPVLSSD